MTEDELEILKTIIGMEYDLQINFKGNHVKIIIDKFEPTLQIKINLVDVQGTDFAMAFNKAYTKLASIIDVLSENYSG